MQNDKSISNITNYDENTFEKIYEKYEQFLGTVSELYGLKTTEQLLNHNYNLYNNYNKIPTNNIKVTLLTTHGIVGLKQFIVPSKLVVVFLTPANYSSCLQFKPVDLQKIIPENLHYIQNNLLCLNKDVVEFNPKKFDNIFTNAIIFLPGQACLDMFFNYSEDDHIRKNAGFWDYYLNDNHETIASNRQIKSIDNETLANICINEQKTTHNLKYLIINCCRSFNSFITIPELTPNDIPIYEKLWKTTYINETFTYYFNTLMANCNELFTAESPLKLHSKIHNFARREYPTDKLNIRNPTRKSQGKSGKLTLRSLLNMNRKTKNNTQTNHELKLQTTLDNISKFIKNKESM